MRVAAGSLDAVCAAKAVHCAAENPRRLHRHDEQHLRAHRTLLLDHHLHHNVTCLQRAEFDFQHGVEVLPDLEVLQLDRVGRDDLDLGECVADSDDVLAELAGLRLLRRLLDEVVARKRAVGAIRILLHHAVRVELRRNGREAVDHALDPSLRQPTFVPRKIGRNQFVLDEAIQRRGVGLVLQLRIRVNLPCTNGPAVLAVGRLRPPTIADREIEHAIGRGLHARRAAGLFHASRGVDPDVDALHQRACQRDLIVLDEDDLAGKLRRAAQLYDPLHHVLAEAIARVRFASDHDADRTLGVIEQATQSSRLGEQQMRALVRRKTTSKPKIECVGH